MSVFSEHLKEARRQSGMSQKEMAEKMEMSDRGWRFYENGEQEPTVMRAAKMARILGVSLDYLAGLKDEEDSQ